jgi:hypothetical protein
LPCLKTAAQPERSAAPRFCDLALNCEKMSRRVTRQAGAQSPFTQEKMPVFHKWGKPMKVYKFSK